MKNFKNYLTIILFVAVLLSTVTAYVVMPDNNVSYAERRELADFPQLTAKTVLSHEFSELLEGYFLDQSPLRDKFRYMNTFVRMQMLAQNDVNGIYKENGYLFKNDKPLDLKQVDYGKKMINKVISKYLGDMNVYYSIIPEKGYYSQSGRTKLDHSGIVEAMASGIEDATYIDIFDTLSLEDYYRTDTHWMQEKLQDTVERLVTAMGKESGVWDYEEVAMENFDGVYLSQSGFGDVEADTLKYLTNTALENAKVYGIPADVLKSKFGSEDTLTKKVYATEKFHGMDGYDVFLSGAQPVVTVELAEGNGKELVIFRDSFGSSIAPLMLGAYQKVTLVDLRYVMSDLIGDYVDFNVGQDVLFLYSASMLNSSMLMK